MIDKKRILAKVDELNRYLDELEQIKPSSLDEYESAIEKKRSCERLLQISIETIIDTCNILSANLKLGIPEDEDALFEKLKQGKIISEDIRTLLREMKGFRNILVQKYGEVNDELVFENLSKLSDFITFRDEIMEWLKKQKTTEYAS